MTHKSVHGKRKAAGCLLLLTFTLTLFFGLCVPASAAGLSMSTPYPGLSVKAGDELSFDLDFDNSSGAGCSVTLTESQVPEGWDGYFTGDGSEISRVYVREGENLSAATYQVSVPADAAEGEYTIVLQAGGGGMTSTLQLVLQVTEEQLGSSSLSAEYAQQEGSSGTSFSFSVTVQNNTASEQTYSLSANTPDGWMVTFQPTGESTQVAAVTVPARSSQGLTVTVTPPASVAAEEFTIPISAISATETLKTELSVTITGTYALELSTPSGLLSFDATANKGSDVTLSLTNSGNVDLQNINLTSSLPDGWSVTFSESTIDLLEAGATKEVTMTVTPSDSAMSGDYASVISASNSQVSDSVEFRVSVKTETVWGIVGILLIVAAAAGLWYVFRKYGRR